MKKNKAFTLVEVCIVIVIMGILAVIAMSTFGGSTEKAAEREAFVNLDMVVSGAEIYRMNTGAYPPTASVNTTAKINTNFRTNLSTTASRKWDYGVVTSGSGATAVACVTAVRVKSGTATTPCWRLCTNTTPYEPFSVTCP